MSVGLRHPHVVATGGVCDVASGGAREERRHHWGDQAGGGVIASCVPRPVCCATRRIRAHCCAARGGWGGWGGYRGWVATEARNRAGNVGRKSISGLRHGDDWASNVRLHNKTHLVDFSGWSCELTLYTCRQVCSRVDLALYLTRRGGRCS